MPAFTSSKPFIANFPLNKIINHQSNNTGPNQECSNTIGLMVLQTFSLHTKILFYYFHQSFKYCYNLGYLTRSLMIIHHKQHFIVILHKNSDCSFFDCNNSTTNDIFFVFEFHTNYLQIQSFIPTILLTQ